MVTIEQQIARKEDELARLKKKKLSLENGQKIVLGGMLLRACQDDPKQAKNALELIEKFVERKTDKDRLEQVITRLQKVVSDNSEVANNANSRT